MPSRPRLFIAICAACMLSLFGRSAAPQSGAAASLAPDIVVAADGSGHFTTVQAAVDSIPKDNRERRIIFVKKGVYTEKVRIDASCVTLSGSGREQTRIEFAQGSNEFRSNPDRLGVAVVNVNGDDCVIENLTVANTHGVIGVHAFAIYGRGDRTVIQDCDVLSQGNDTLSLWRTSDRTSEASGTRDTGVSPNGRYYHARLRVRGSVDFICPRGWCYMTDSDIYEVNPNAEAAIWHDGSRDRNMKFVLRGCRFDGVEGWRLGRHHHDAQIFLIDCTFSSTMRDTQPRRVVYPLGGKPATDADRKRNAELDATNRWGERFYFWHCRRTGGDYPWHQDNLAAAADAPKAGDVTAAWTFDHTWDPESTVGPAIERVESKAEGALLTFSEPVTVKGVPRLTLRNGQRVQYRSGSGTTQLLFVASAESAPSDAAAAAVMASHASATLRFANLTLP